MNSPGLVAVSGLRKELARAEAPDKDSDSPASRARADLGEFIRQSWVVLEPATPLEWNWHHEAMCLHVQAQFEDWIKHQQDPAYKQRFQNLLINVPPGTMKSRIVSVCAPAWMWLRWPQWRAIFLSSNPRVALRDSMYCRDLVTSDWYRETFAPDWELAPDQDAKSLFKNTVGGFRQAMGFSARITGDRADALIWDDPHDAVEVVSDVKREFVIDRWDNAISNRVNDARSSLRMGIMQRLHEHDLAGHVLAKGGWEHLCLPMEKEEKPACRCPSCQAGQTLIGWSDPRTEVGEVLHPVRFTPEVLDGERARFGPGGYAGQMQQNPIPSSGGMVKITWFGRYDYPAGEKPADAQLIVLSFDTASKAKELNDPWVCTVWAVTPSWIDIIHVFAKRMEYPEGKRTAIALCDTWRPNAVLIEDKSSGQQLIQEMRLETNHPIIAIEPHGDKVTRMSLETPIMAAGKVRLPKRADWLFDFEYKLGRFPQIGKDEGDSVSQFLKWNRETGLVPPPQGEATTADMTAIIVPPPLVAPINQPRPGGFNPFLGR